MYATTYQIHLHLLDPFLLIGKIKCIPKNYYPILQRICTKLDVTHVTTFERYIEQSLMFRTVTSISTVSFLSYYIINFIALI